MQNRTPLTHSLGGSVDLRGCRFKRLAKRSQAFFLYFTLTRLSSTDFGFLAKPGGRPTIRKQTPAGGINPRQSMKHACVNNYCPAHGANGPQQEPASSVPEISNFHYRLSVSLGKSFRLCGVQSLAAVHSLRFLYHLGLQ